MTAIPYRASQFTSFVNQVRSEGCESTSRQGPTRELLAAQYEVLDCDYLIADSSRRFNLGFAYAEFLSLVTGYSNIDFFQQHIANYDQFSTNGVLLDNSYGGRLSGWIESDGNRSVRLCNSQLDRCVEILRADESARYAVATINDGRVDLFSQSSHVPCTLSLQWLIRDGRLHQIVTMRSNDVMLGVSTDVFVFGCLHQLMAARCGVPVGRYVCNAASLHFYESDTAKADLLSDAPSLPIDFSHQPTELDIGWLLSAAEDDHVLVATEMGRSWLRDICLCGYSRWNKNLLRDVSPENRQLADWSATKWTVES